MFSCTDFLFLFYLIFYHFISVAHSPFLRLLHSQQSEPCKEPFALFQKLLSRAIRKDEERKHDLFSSCDLKAPPPLPSWIFHYFRGREKVLCVFVCCGRRGGILIIVHAWVINQFRRYWKTVDGRCCSEGKKSKRGKYEGGVFWFVPVGSQDFFKKMMLFFFFF